MFSIISLALWLCTSVCSPKCCHQQRANINSRRHRRNIRSASKCQCHPKHLPFDSSSSMLTSYILNPSSEPNTLIRLDIHTCVVHVLLACVFGKMQPYYLLLCEGLFSLFSLKCVLCCALPVFVHVSSVLFL